MSEGTHDVVDNFETRHAQVDPDPIVELRRRLQFWASAPDSRGMSLNACIVPDETMLSALAKFDALSTENRRLREALENAIPALQRVHAMTPGGPKKSDALANLNRALDALRASASPATE